MGIMMKVVNWLNCHKLQQLIDIAPDDLLKKIREFHISNNCNGAVRVFGGEYFLAKDCVDEFIEKFNLKPLRNVPDQDNHWISVIKLSGIFRMRSWELVDLLRKFKDDACMRDANGMQLIQFRKTSHGRYVSLCLFNSNEAKCKFAEKIGIKTNMFSNKVPYKMRYDWSDKSKFSDQEIDDAIIRLMNKNYDFACETQCADALMSELPKSSDYIINSVRRKSR